MKIIRNSVVSIIVGVILSILSTFCKGIGEPINYVGAMFIFGGMVFLDQCLMKKIYEKRPMGKLSLVRLPAYLLLGVLCLMIPTQVTMSVYMEKVLRGFGISLFLLALWRFFTFTTIGQQEIHSK